MTTTDYKIYQAIRKYYASEWYENLLDGGICWCTEGRNTEGENVCGSCKDCVNNEINLCQCVLDDYLAYLDAERQGESPGNATGAGYKSCQAQKKE